MAVHRPAKEGVTAVAGASSSAARRQPAASGQGARVPQQSRAEPADGAGIPADAAVALVAADAMAPGMQAAAGERPRTSSRRESRRAAQQDAAAPERAGAAADPAVSGSPGPAQKIRRAARAADADRGVGDPAANGSGPGPDRENDLPGLADLEGNVNLAEVTDLEAEPELAVADLDADLDAEPEIGRAHV
jgi:hypothetical protein